MKILITGTPGVRKRLALQNLQAAQRALFPDQRIFTYNTPSEIPVLEELLYKNTPSPFLKLPEQARKRQWQQVFTTIVNKFERAQTDIHVLGLHLTYRHKQIPSCAVDFKMLGDWKPDAIVTLIDDAYLVRRRIHEGGYSSFSLAELILWRAEELLVGDLLARTVNPESPPPNYLLSVNHSSRMLARLLFSPRDNLARVYLSYNISDSRKTPESRRVIDDFRRKMSEQSTCAAFDPLTIDELPPAYLARRKRSTAIKYSLSDADLRWPHFDLSGMLSTKIETGMTSVPTTELKSALDAIDAHVRHRDIRLVDQAHFLVIYRPTFVGDPKATKTLSTGVQGEFHHATHTGCPVIWYFKEGEDPLPTSTFVDRNPHEDPDIFHQPTEDKFWTRISQLHREANRERDYFLR